MPLVDPIVSGSHFIMEPAFKFADVIKPFVEHSYIHDTTFLRKVAQIQNTGSCILAVVVVESLHGNIERDEGPEVQT